MVRHRVAGCNGNSGLTAEARRRGGAERRDRNQGCRGWACPKLVQIRTMNYSSHPRAELYRDLLPVMYWALV